MDKKEWMERCEENFDAMVQAVQIPEVAERLDKYLSAPSEYVFTPPKGD